MNLRLSNCIHFGHKVWDTHTVEIFERYAQGFQESRDWHGQRNILRDLLGHATSQLRWSAEKIIVKVLDEIYSHSLNMRPLLNN